MSAIGIGTQGHGDTKAQRKQKVFSVPCVRAFQKIRINIKSITKSITHCNWQVYSSG